MERTLRGAGVSEYDISENINYYDSYFQKEIVSGRREEDISEELGDPRLIAKTIINVHISDNYEEAAGSYDSESGRYEEHDSTGNAGSQKGFRAELNGNGWDVRFGKFKINSWYGYLLIAIIVFAVLSLFFTIISGLFALAAPILVPVLVIMLVFNLFFRRR